MKLLVTYDQRRLFETLLKEKLDLLDVGYKIVGNNEIVFENELSIELQNHISELLKPYGIEVTEQQNLAIADRIKSAINDMLTSEDAQIVNTSDYLSEKLNYSYSYLSNLFSETTYTSIENYIILCKVDKAKELLLQTDLTLTEIAFKLHYSSVAHLSRQFKKTTGLTPSMFQNIIQKRKQLK